MTVMTTPLNKERHMNYELRKTDLPGGGWLVKATPAYTPGSDGNIRPTMYAFRTLDSARRFIGNNSQISKRVRMTRHSDAFYTYRA